MAGAVGVHDGRKPGWHRRRWLSGSVRTVLTLVPVAASIAVALTLNSVLPAASGIVLDGARSLLLALCSLVALVLADTLARRFLPLAALLQLSLVFPDRTPSRFRLALKGGSGRRLAREVDEARRSGLSDEPSRAAEQLVLLATAIGDHDRRTRGHSERVRLYAELIAEELHLDDDERAKLQWAALIHDIGKIAVPAAILNKKGRPDDREWAVLRNHSAAGEALVAGVEPRLGEWVHAVGGHNERWDGTGYPRRLHGDAIPRAAAIVAVADSFEVMTAVRSYKKSMPLAAARAELTRCAGTHFSPEVVRALLNVSLGRLRRSMGVFAALAPVPFLGRASAARGRTGVGRLAPAACSHPATRRHRSPADGHTRDGTDGGGALVAQGCGLRRPAAPERRGTRARDPTDHDTDASIGSNPGNDHRPRTRRRVAHDHDHGPARHDRAPERRGARRQGQARRGGWWWRRRRRRQGQARRLTSAPLRRPARAR